MSVATRMVDVGPYRLNVQHAGSGPPLLLVHSLTLDSHMWRAQIDALSSRFCVHAVDLHGHGQSGGEAGATTLEAMADDLARLLDALGIDRVGYCGLSIGGMLGMRLALQHPNRVAALALMNTTAEPELPTKRMLFEHLNQVTLNRPADDKTVRIVLDLMLSPAFQASHPEVTQRVYDTLFIPNNEGMYWVAKAVFAREDIRDAIATLDVPTVVVTSDVDTAIPTEFAVHVAEAIPGARLVTYEGSGHLTAVERADEVNALLDSFFGDHLQADLPPGRDKGGDNRTQGAL